MRAYDAVFYGAASFLIGVFLSSFLPLRASVFIALACAGAIFFVSYALRKKFLAHLAVLFLFFALAGGAYFARAQSGILMFQNNIPQEDIVITAVVLGDPEHGRAQKAVVLPEGNGMRKILVTLPAYPVLSHGDTLTLVGKIETPQNEGYSKYLAARGIGGTMYFPRMLSHKEGGASLHRELFGIKRAVVAIFSRALPVEHSALLSGITLGEREEFSKELKDAMSKSGTSHITALSGYNITVVSSAMLAVFAFFIDRKRALVFALAAISLFVIMTGAEPSVVRAAIMGSILLLAQRAGRRYSARNAIALTAFFMTLYNPYVLSFDAGFQLSFAALLGMLYISPILLPHRNEEGFFGVRESAAHTVAAQAAVFPIISSYFGTASLTSILANVLIVGVIPLTMFLGFALGAIGFFSAFFASLLGWAVGLLLSYEISVIYFFSSVSIPLPHVGILGAAFYYGLLVFLVAQAHIQKQKRYETIV